MAASMLAPKGLVAAWRRRSTPRLPLDLAAEEVDATALEAGVVEAWRRLRARREDPCSSAGEAGAMGRGGAKWRWPDESWS